MAIAIPHSLRFLLLQIRNADDPMREQEIDCFAETIPCRREQILVHSLLEGAPRPSVRSRTDVVLLGGSGDYSVASEGIWLDRAMDVLRDLHDSRQPTFASCWGFQAMARAMGGTVVHDPENAEVGTHEIHLTQQGERDPLFAPLAPRFAAQMGHEDRVDRLPAEATHLARSEQAVFQAFCFPDRPIYCTQFHPELSRRRLLERVRAYPRYVTEVLGMSLAEFVATCRETPEANTLLGRFVRQVLDVPTRGCS